MLFFFGQNFVFLLFISSLSLGVWFVLFEFVGPIIIAFILNVLFSAMGASINFPLSTAFAVLHYFWYVHFCCFNELFLLFLSSSMTYYIKLRAHFLVFMQSTCSCFQILLICGWHKYIMILIMRFVLCLNICIVE